ncbi:uncharacterized protein DUF4291 [Chitinophaga skermanii]|uniref:Uncharacterized protein DUF4291 n=1 Tax=Chitinophaga skermanii TaxID=331697 RepID=A0A327QCH5_9BACT|nr:DUF4291 domain-containing protein [Chitinophaga skermanii]RAJ02259.1 uncharacterized protein DUF4291 [Chitinophaga skermanii]
MKDRIIRASYDEETITVYQAFNTHIAQAAVRRGTFCAPFKRDRMTWIKPSFLWMMYRSGWATKENQEHILAVKLKRAGFEEALSMATLATFNTFIYTTKEDWQSQLQSTPVRVQWDPEKDLHLNPLPYRSIQIGLSGEAVHRYLDNWIVDVQDITPFCKEVHHLVQTNQLEAAQQELPAELEYPLPFKIGETINLSV